MRPKIEPKERKDKSLYFRTTLESYEWLQEVADEAGRTVSDTIHTIIQMCIEEEAQANKKKRARKK